MKILFYSSYFYPYTSGITTYPFKIISHLAKKHDITVLTFNHKINKYEEESISGFNIKRMPYLIKIYKGFISPQSFTYFFDEIKRNDLIIINLPNVEGLVLTLLAKLYRKRVISILHCFLGLSQKLYLKIINSITNLIITFQLLLSDKVISYTDDYINSLPINKLIKNKLETVLPPILKLPVSKNKKTQLLKLKGNKVWIGYAGRISNEKGLEYLIEGLPNSVELIFAGPYGLEVSGENSYYLTIKKLLDTRKIKYRFLGNLNNVELGAFYRTIDVLVLPSTNRTEAFGMVQAEAMLLGTPVISADLPGVRVPVKLTRMGSTIRPKNSDQINKSIKRILKNKTKYSNISLIKNADKIFSINNVYKFYDRIINEKD